MNIKNLSWRNLLSSPLNSTLSILLMTLGIGMISLILLINTEVNQQVERNLKGIDMVVGAKGSPLQLILSSVYHIDNPTGNIPLEEAKKIEKNPLVASSIPISLGDSYNGFRIVGTNLDYLDLFDVKLKSGRLWKQSLEVVLGHTVAEANDLNIGDTFHGSHGLIEGGAIHDEFDYKIVGILTESQSVVDQLILTTTNSIWKVHDHGSESSHDHHHDENCTHDHGKAAEITALLVKFKSPIGLMQLPRQINEKTQLQAALPAFEISRLMNLMGFGIQAMNLIAVIIMIVSGLSIFISLYNALKRRKYELAFLRVYGASKKQLIQLIMQEGVLLAFLGTVLGLLSSRLILIGLSFFGSQTTMIKKIQLIPTTEEVWLAVLGLTIGIMASLIPTIQAYKMNIPKTLSNA